MTEKAFNNQMKSVKAKEKELEEQFQNDNYLIQTIKRTKKFQSEKKYAEYHNNLKDVLNLINTKIKLGNNPKTKLIHEENNEFLNEYKYFSNKFEAQTEQILKDLIITYVNRGYRIPKFSYKNNIFKVNSLIEENGDKLRLIFLEDLKNKNNIIGSKALMFLDKLNFLMNKRTLKNLNLIDQYNKVLKENEALRKKLSIENLKEDIENMKNLVKTVKLSKVGSVQPKRNSSYISKINQFNSFKLSHSKNSSKVELSNTDKSNNNEVILSTEGSGNVILKRNPLSFLSVRLKKYPIRPKNIDSMFSNNQTESSQYTENNIGKEKKIILKKSKPEINLKMKNIYPNIKNNDKRIKTAKNYEKIKEFKSYSKKTTCSNIEKYIEKTKKNKFCQSTKKANNSELKKINNNKNRNGFSPQKELSKYSENSFDNSKKLYKKTKRVSEDKMNASRNTNFSSEITKIGKTEESERKKSKYLNKTYMKLKKGNYDSVEDLMHKYLKDIKKLDKNEYDDLMNKYNYKNFRNNIIELNMKVGNNKIRNKIEKIYSNNHIFKRISTSLNNMKEEETNIDRLEKMYTSGVNRDY